MASQFKAFKLNHALAKAMALRTRQQGYSSEAAYVKALIRKDLLKLPPHTLIKDWSRLPFPAQDTVDIRLLDRIQQFVPPIEEEWSEYDLLVKPFSTRRAA